MCSTCVERKAIKVTRKAITVATENGWYLGKWYAMPKPKDEQPPNWKIKSSERILWCPWCMDWSIYKKVGTDRWECRGICGWGNTDEWYVQTYNKIWWEDVPLEKMKNISIPAPAKRKK
jgi:hypothetical protein